MSDGQRMTQLYHWGCALAECLSEGRAWMVVSLRAPGSPRTFIAGHTLRTYQ